MTIQVLPSGRWRARVWVEGKGDVPVSRILGEGRQSFKSRREAAAAVKRARAVVNVGASRIHRRTTARPPGYVSQAWTLATKGEDSCRACGVPPQHLHHIVPSAVYPAGVRDVARNGVPLCGRCHYGWHNRTHELPHTILTDAEFLFACDAQGIGWVGRHYHDPALSAESRQYLMAEVRARAAA